MHMIRRKSLRSRLAILAAITTGIVSIAISLFGYALARRNVTDEIDNSLVREVQRYASRIESRGNGSAINPDLETAPLMLVQGNGRVVRSTTAAVTALTTLDIEIAQGAVPARFSHRTVAGKHHRFYTVPIHISPAATGRLTRMDRANGGEGLALAVGRNVESADLQLRRLALGFLILATTGTAISALAAFTVVRIGTRPLTDLKQIIHAIATEGDAPFVASMDGPADIAQLSDGVNTMLDALRESRETQQRMIDDAAHELRTPMTSMQTNLDLLSRGDELAPDVKHDVVRALHVQFRELRLLVDDLALLSEESTHASRRFDLVELDQVVLGAVERARRRTHSTTFEVDVQPFVVLGNADRLERALVNVLDNSIKWSPLEGTVSVTLSKGTVTIEDEGPGVPVEERGRVFDRFWRAPSTRGTPGSGLGLAIVAEVVHEHHGTVHFGESARGGAMVTLSFPPTSRLPTTTAKSSAIDQR